MLDLGKTIQTLREQSGMSQKELAKRVGVSTGAIGNYEAGLRRPKFETIEALADIFNIPIGLLIGDESSARILMCYDKLHTLIDMADRLDPSDLARLEERAAFMLESEKYTK